MVDQQGDSAKAPPPPVAVGPELFFALVGPAGTDLETALGALTGSLRARDYAVHTIRLSEILRDRDNLLQKEWGGFEERRIRLAMDAGNNLCKKISANDAVVRLGLAKVRSIRRTANKTKSGDENVPLRRTAFIFNSLKRPEECDLLREVCGDAFFLVSVYEPRHKRKSNLAHRIAKSHNAAVSLSYTQSAERIIQDDEAEEDQPFG